MTVYIAEKPDIASSMASFLWSDYAACRNKHCYQKGDVIVTWAYGHILMTAMPETYDKEYADFSKYPIFPTSWKKYPSPSTKEQFGKSLPTPLFVLCVIFMDSFAIGEKVKYQRVGRG